MSAALELAVVPVTPFAQNCSIIKCARTGKAALVDPGGDPERILAAVKKLGATVEKVLLTHGHIDHAGGAGALAQRLGVPIEGPHREDGMWLEGLDQQAQMFGLGGAASSFTPTRWLVDGDTVTVGELVLEVLHCPGHTAGHVVFFLREQKLAFVGDVLFQGSVGRSDLPGGDHDTLIRSIKERLLPLGDEVRFVSGHGPMSTFGDEREHNPFLV